MYRHSVKISVCSWLRYRGKKVFNNSIIFWTTKNFRKTSTRALDATESSSAAAAATSVEAGPNPRRRCEPKFLVRSHSDRVGATRKRSPKTKKLSSEAEQEDDDDDDKDRQLQGHKKPNAEISNDSFRNKSGPETLAVMPASLYPPASSMSLSSLDIMEPNNTTNCDNRTEQLALQLALLQGNYDTTSHNAPGSRHLPGHQTPSFAASDLSLGAGMGNLLLNGSGVGGGSLEDLKGRRSQNMTECVPVPSSEHVAEIVGRQGESF